MKYRLILLKLTCFHASFCPFCPPFAGHPSSPPFLSAFSPSQNALFCTVRGTAQSLEMGDLSAELGRKFLPEICVKKGQSAVNKGAGEKGAPRNHPQGTLKGTNLRGQTEPKRTFSQIFADFCRFSPFFLENKAFGKRRFSQETAENRRNPQKTADWRLSP